MSERPRLGLAMIVRNESAVIERCLASVRPYIDRWVICDTGSTDDTIARIRRALDGIPGALHERPWVDFAHNRTELMDLAHGVAGHLLLIDADMTLAGEMGSLTEAAYTLRQGDDRFDYRNVRLVRGDLRWRYHGATHEYIECLDLAVSPVPLDSAWIVDHGDGGAKADKFIRDRRLLEAELAATPDDPRATFYLAQTLRDLAATEPDPAAAEALAGEALTRYRRRIELGGWAEELAVAGLEAGRLHRRLGDWPAAADAFVAAHEAQPGRLEPVHELVLGLLDRRHHHTAVRFTVDAAAGPLTPPGDGLFVEPWIYHWGLAFQHVIAAYWVGDHTGAIRTATWLLERDDLPGHYREQTERNLEFARHEQIARDAREPLRRLWAHSGQPTRGRASGPGADEVGR